MEFPEVTGMARTLTCAVAGVLGLVASTPVAAQAPTLEMVLGRAASYVAEFQTRLSGIVAEETYVQQVVPGERRELKSDLLLVRPPRLDRWIQFRDIFEVDGEPVRDREERLSALFLQPARSAVDQARRIVAESSRYNAGDLIRTINVPLLPLFILEAGNQERFRFSVARNDVKGELARDLPASPHFRVTAEVWVIGFKERRSPTLVRDPVRRKDVFSHGRFWIEPATGRVFMSEMIAQQSEVRAEITVSYQSEPLLGMLVPIEMRERYSSTEGRNRPRKPWERIEASASYGRFRQFDVRVDERTQPAR
jgi:hypothetical protein